MSKKIYIEDKHVSYVPSLTKEKRASFSVFIEVTLLNKFLLLKYKWSQFPFEVVQWYAINILSKYFLIQESHFLFTRSVARRKRGESCNPRVLFNPNQSVRLPGYWCQRGSRSSAAFLPLGECIQSPTWSVIFKLCSKMEAIAQLQMDLHSLA